MTDFSSESMVKLLVVDDEPAVIALFQHVFVKSGIEIVNADTGALALEIIASSHPDAVMLDVVLPDQDGLEVFRQIKSLDAQLPVIVMTGGRDSQTAIRAMQLGALDYLLKPLDVRSLNKVVRQALDVRRMMVETVDVDATAQQVVTSSSMIGSCEGMQEVYKAIGRVASQNISVLIRGESGTGKELVARAIFQNGSRSEKPFLAINCAAIPEALLESELFGHEKGAFTGAVSSRVGRFELASGGTIFLDEIGDLSPPLQVKLLRVLQERTFERVGGSRTYKSDARVVAATNQDLESLVAAKQFREDLFYRLNVVPILVPPLRQRVEDIPLLLQHFIDMFNDRRKAEITGVADQAMALLCEYPWPGNVREISNIVERIAILKRRGSIEPADLPEKIRRLPSDHLPTMSAAIPIGGLDLSRAVEEFENRLILEALERTNWVKSKAARLLQINRTTLIEKLKKKSLAEVVAQRAIPPDNLVDV